MADWVVVSDLGGKIPILTHICQMGLFNHHLVEFFFDTEFVEFFGFFFLDKT